MPKLQKTAPTPRRINGGKTAISLSVFLLFCALIVTPVSGGVEDENNQQRPETVSSSQETQVAQIIYRIDTRIVTETVVLDTLKKRTHITVGAPFSRQAIQQSVVSLHALAQFSQVNVYALDTPEGVILTFDLKRVVHIKKIEITGVPDELKRALRNAMLSKVGHIYLPAIAESEVPRIKAACTDYGYFSPTVIHKPITAEGQVTYQITLGNPSLIKTLQIQGHESVSTKDIQDACRLSRVGKPYRKYAVETDIAQIRALYRKKHYPTATVVPTFTPKTGVLLLQINQGKQYLIEFLSKKDGRPIVFSSGFRNFLAKFGIGNASSEEMELKEKIINAPFLYKQTIQAHFEVKGYYGTEVSPPEIIDTPLRYHAKFTINPGTRYTVKNISFSGNKAFSDAVLLREMQARPPNRLSRLIRKRFLSKQILETDKQSLKILYKKAGYPKVVIEIDLHKHTPNNKDIGEVEIHVDIVELYKEVIQRCHFIGNQVIDTATLLGALPIQPPQPNESLLEKGYANAVLKMYYERGYVDAEVKTKYMDKTDTAVLEVPGNFSEHLDAGTLPPELRDEFEKQGLTLAGTFIASKIDEHWIIQDAENNARYTLKQHPTSLSVFEHGVLHIEITEGPQVVFGTFYFGGDPGVKRQVLTREVEHLPGTRYTPSKLSRVLQNLYKTGLFEPGIRTTAIERADTIKQTATAPNRNAETSNTVPQIVSLQATVQPRVKDVLIELQRQKPGAYGASIGYNASEGARGTLALSHRNIFKRNIRFLLRGRGGTRAGTLGYLYDATLTEPWFLGRTQGSLQWAERNLEEDDNVRARQASFTLSRELPRDNWLELQYSFRHLRQPDATTITLTDKTTTVSSLRFSWTHNSRFPSINPISGILNEVTLEYAGNLLGGQTNFIKTVTDTRYYRKLHNKGPVLATALRFGITTGIGSSRHAELISFERFWAGGSTTVRGYAERGLGPLDSTLRHRGNVQLIFNTELRFPLYSLFDGVLFFDTGNVWETASEIDIAELPTSVGAGLYLDLGPLRGGFDYAVPLRTIPDSSENTLYFRIGSIF